MTPIFVYMYSITPCTLIYIHLIESSIRNCKTIFLTIKTRKYLLSIPVCIIYTPGKYKSYNLFISLPPLTIDSMIFAYFVSIQWYFMIVLICIF